MASLPLHAADAISRPSQHMGGNDTLDGRGVSGILIHGGDGDDTLYAAESFSYHYDDAGPGYFAPYGISLAPGQGGQLHGDTGNDLITGGLWDDRLNGGADNDRINGILGNDLIEGGTETDILQGGEGNDQLYATTEADWASLFTPGATATTLDQDWLAGGNGDDLLRGSAGNDLFKILFRQAA